MGGPAGQMEQMVAGVDLYKCDGLSLSWAIANQEPLVAGPELYAILYSKAVSFNVPIKRKPYTLIPPERTSLLHCFKNLRIL